MSAEPVSPRTTYRKAVVVTFGVATVVLGFVALYVVRNILVLALIALFVAISLDPAVRFLVKHGMRRSYAVALIFGLAFLAVVGLLAAVGPPMVRQGVNLGQRLPDYVADLTDRSRTLKEISDRYGVTDDLVKMASSLPGKIGGSVLAFIKAFFGAIFTSLLVIVLSIYFMADLPRLRHGVARLFPADKRQRVQHASDVVVDKVGAYMIGNLAISLVAGVATFAVLAILGVPFALPLALAVAIADLIPMIGATLGAVITVAVTLIATELWPTTVVVVIFFVVYQQLENYLIAPRILRNSVDLPAVAVLLAGLIGGTLLGLIGALMAIPIAAVIKVLLTPMIGDPVESEPAEPPPDTLTA